MTRPGQGGEAVQIKISARHGHHLSDATQQFIRDKAEKLLRYFDRLTSIEVTVDVEGKLVEFLAHAEHKHEFVAHETNADVLVAVDAAVSKIEGQIRRYKEKIQDHRRRPSHGDVTAPAPEQSEE
jgi:putative sigma-54 modulation protein